MKIFKMLILLLFVVSLLFAGCSTDAQITGDATHSDNMYPGAEKSANSGFKASGTGHEAFCY